MAIRGLALLAGAGAAGLWVARWITAQQRSRVARSLVEDQIEPTKRTVVLGAGFGGLYAAIRMADAVWDDPDVEVLLIDRHWRRMPPSRRCSASS